MLEAGSGGPGRAAEKFFRGGTASQKSASFRPLVDVHVVVCNVIVLVSEVVVLSEVVVVLVEVEDVVVVPKSK
jgi:hypothetical protein